MNRIAVVPKLILLILLTSFSFVICNGEELKVVIEPNNKDWIYKVDETAYFKVSISGNSTKPVSIQYAFGPEKMDAVIRDSFSTSDSVFIIEGGTMEIPGFMRCNVTVSDGVANKTEIATAAFQPEDIQPTVEYPDDFLEFWEKTIANSREIPLDAEFTLLEDKSTESFSVYHVSYLNHEYKNRSYGIITIPAKEGKFPAIIRYPGAGVHPLGGNLSIADKDVITLDLYIHPFSMLWEKSFYDNLKESPYIEYKFWGSAGRDTYYYKSVITGCVKAVDLIFSLEQFDGENLASWGSSQGGALSIITTSLDKRIKLLVAVCPAMCDYTGYLHGRAGGWPHFFSKENIEQYNNEEVLETLPYYDVVNFARNITVPGFYTWGFNDETTPPTSFYSAYNVINANKELFIIPEGKHRIYPVQRIESNNWIFDYFSK